MAFYEQPDRLDSDVLVIVYWNLGFICNLVLVIWNLLIFIWDVKLASRHSFLFPGMVAAKRNTFNIIFFRIPDHTQAPRQSPAGHYTGDFFRQIKFQTGRQGLRFYLLPLQPGYFRIMAVPPKQNLSWEIIAKSTDFHPAHGTDHTG